MASLQHAYGTELEFVGSHLPLVIQLFGPPDGLLVTRRRLVQPSQGCQAVGMIDDGNGGHPLSRAVARLD